MLSGDTDPDQGWGYDGVYTHFERRAVLSNGDILFFPQIYYDYLQQHYNIYKLNSSNGDVTTVEYNGDIPYRIQAVEVDDNNNIYVGSKVYDSTSPYDFYDSSLIKHDSNLNVLWNMTVSDNGTGNNEAYVYDIEYDSINDLLYVIGVARAANINPLGTSTIVSNNANSGVYFAAYNTSGILQLSHGFETDVNSSVGTNYNSTLEIFNNKLILRTYFNGYVDFDVTDGIFYTPLTGISSGSFLSIYDLTNGLDFTGHYFDQNGLFNGDIFYKDDKIKVGYVGNNIYVNNFYDYDGSYWFEPDNIAYTNVITQNSQYGAGAGVMELLLEDENLPTNFAPISEGIYASLWTNNTETINIQLRASDQDGDALTFTLVTPPANGTVTITGDKATYTPNENYYGSDSFTFEAVDTTAKKVLNTATASITINPINDAPTATDVEADAYDNQSIDIDLPIEDVDEDNLSIQIVDNPSKVTLSLNGSSVTVYNPNHYWGTDSFTYQAYDGTEYSETKTVSLGMKRNVDYNIPSHDFENYIMPWFDLASITTEAGIDCFHCNTSSAYADFNGDNYFDIMLQPDVNDGVPVDIYFLINNGDNSFYIDNDFPININTSAISSRKTIVGDFNGDGKPDVVRPQGGHDYLGKPTITLSNEDGYDFNLIDSAPDIQPHTLSSGDIDSDGDLDLFFAQAGEYDGFALNDGNGNFSWRWIDEIITDFDKGHTYPTGGYGYYGFWSSEMTDVDSDGLIDLILGGSYKDQDYDAMFDGATILWGDGNGYYSMENSTTLFISKNLLKKLYPSVFFTISNTHDASSIISRIFIFENCILIECGTYFFILPRCDLIDLPHFNNVKS